MLAALFVGQKIKILVIAWSQKSPGLLIIVLL